MNRTDPNAPDTHMNKLLAAAVILKCYNRETERT